MKNCWNLEKIYKNDAEVQAAVSYIESLLKNISDLKENPLDNLKALLDEVFEASKKMETLYAYSHMKRDEDSRVSKYQKLALEVEALANEVSTACSFLEPFILSLSEDKLNAILTSEEFSLYHKYLNRILRFKPYTLSEKEEYVLSMTSEIGGAPENAFYMLSYADMVFPVLENHPEKERLTQSNYVPILSEGDLNLRKEAFSAYYKVYGEHINTLASTLFSNIKRLVIEAKLRGYESALSMELYKNQISTKVYDALIESVRRYLPSLEEYFSIKKSILGLEEYHMYDIYIPAMNDLDKKISYEEAKKMVYEAVAPLGEDYQAIIKKAFDENWIDVYPRDGKKSGAYSWGSYETDPYILMNYNDNLDSVFTLAHELGHSVHSYYSREANPYVYSNYTLFVAEVASTFNELLLLDYLLERAESKEEKIYLINYYLDSYKGTVFRQTQFAEFEKKTHERVENKEALTAEDFTSMYYDLNKTYYGKHVISDEKIGMEWARIPHFYSNFYVYQYATGLSASSVLSQGVLSKKEGALQAYKVFLHDGGQHYPLEQLKSAGADMENPQTVDIALQKFDSLVKELKKLS